MSFSWFKQVLSWLQKGPSEKRGVDLDSMAFQRICEEDPETARELLRADQRDLIQEFEKAYQAYRERFKRFSTELASQSSSQRARELAVLRETQDAFRRTLRRLETSLKTARELERELMDWQTVDQIYKRHDKPRDLHADHPQTRLEIIRSELALRQKEVEGKKDQKEDVLYDSKNSKRDTETLLSTAREEREEQNTIPQFNPEHLLLALRNSVTEAERWHAITQPDEEALHQVHDVKKLSAMLKYHDRQQGIQRDRLSLAIRMRD